MRSKVFLGTLALLCAIAFAVPANAMNIAGTDYVLFGKTAVKMEDGPVNITGNVGVNDVGGLLRIGAQNKIFGTTTADKTFFGSNAKVTDCEFNTNTGGNPGNVCGTQAAAAVPITVWPPAPVPVVPVNNSNQNCPVNGNLVLAPGTYGDVDVKDGCTLDLSPGTYNFKTLRLQTGSVTNGNGAEVNVKGSIITEPAVTVNDATLTSVNSGTFEAIVIGNASILNDVVLYAPNARMHLHQGGVYTNFEAVAVFITVEPITITGQAGGCACVGTIAKSGSTVLLTDGCGLNNSNNKFFLDTVCEACPAGAGCNAATVQPGATSTNATLDIPAGLVQGNYHVIINSPAGSFCTTSTLPLPLP